MRRIQLIQAIHRSHLEEESIFVDDEIKSRRSTSYVALRHKDNPELTHPKGNQIKLPHIFRLFLLLLCNVQLNIQGFLKNLSFVRHFLKNFILKYFIQSIGDFNTNKLVQSISILTRTRIHEFVESDSDLCEKRKELFW